MIAERRVRSAKSECLSKIVIFGEDGLRWALAEYLDHYHKERAHQALGNVAPASEDAGAAGGPVRCRERLGGLLKHYYRAAG